MKSKLILFFLITFSYSYQAQVTNQWKVVSAGTFFSAGIKSDGTLWVWGADPSQFSMNGYPVKVGLDTDWLAVSCGTSHLLMLKEDSSLWSMGQNEYGQLGIGNTWQAFNPQLINSTSQWVQINAGCHHSAAVKDDGSLWTWGANYNGQLGVGGSLNSSSPLQVQVPGFCKSVALHSYHTLAIFDNVNGGKLYAWGENLYGQLGNGTTINSTVPIEIIQANSPNSSWTAVAAGQYFSAVLRSDSTLWVFGNNEAGQLGPNLAQGSLLLPAEFEAGSKWLGIKAGDSFCYGIKADSNVYTWGNNSLGTLGTGNILPQNAPFLLGNALNYDINAFSLSKTPIFSASLIGAHVLALSADHSSICSVGSNDFGQLGNGTTTSRSYFDCDISAQANIIENNTFELAIYPNPSAGKFTLEAALEAGQVIALYNLNGQQVFKEDILNSVLSQTLEINLAPGMYVLQLMSQDGVQLASIRLAVE
jgi:alpha-tubulin suppressor-like RCC1 family protein